MSRLGLIALLRVALLSVLLAALPGQAQIIRISVDQFLGDVDAGSAEAVVNGAGSLIAFESDATNLVSGDTNGMKDVFVHQQTSLQAGKTVVGDNDTRETTRVSVASDGSQANGASYSPSISGCGTSCVDDDNFDADGRYVVFVSEASNLVDNDTNGVADVFMRDRKAGTTTLISANYDSNGQLLGLANGTSSEPHVNEDGCVVFVSEASNLVGTVVTDQGESTVADTNGVKDVFLARPFGTECATSGLPALELVSIDTDGNVSNGASFSPSVGAFKVSFASDASNLVSSDTNAVTDVFVRHLSTGNPFGTIRATTLASRSSDGEQGNAASANPHIEPGGGTVVFDSAASNLVSGDTGGFRDIFVFDIEDQQTTRVSRNPLTGEAADGDSRNPSFSAASRYVVFESDATNLSSERDCNDVTDIFVYNFPFTSTGGNQIAEALERVSVTPGGYQSDAASTNPAMSASGFTVVYQSASNNLAFDIEVRDQTDIYESIASSDPDSIDTDTALNEAPDVCIDGRTAFLRLREFSEGTESSERVLNVRGRKNSNTGQAKGRRRVRTRGKCKATVCYEALLTPLRLNGKRNRNRPQIRLRNKSNTIAAKLKGGQSAKFRAILKRTKAKAIKTSFSPSRTFRVGK